jgi:hypothetical protein
MFTLVWGLLLWVVFVVLSYGVLLVVYVPILLPAFLIATLLRNDAADYVWLIALILCGLLTLAIAYQLGSVYG